MATSTIHVIFNAVVVAKLTYAASSWWGFTTADDRQRLEAVIRRVKRSGLCAPDHMSLEDLVTDADNKLSMAALCNRGAIIFLPCDSFFFYLSFFFPRLISAATDWMSTIKVRI